MITGLATATFPDGSLPEVIDVVRVAANLFAAGQETTVRLLAIALQLLGERPDAPAAACAPTAIASRTSSRRRCGSRARSRATSGCHASATTVGGVDIPAGTTVMVLNGAANRDPRRFEHADEFHVDRANARQHIAFGHGVHTCPGAPLARAEARVSIERILDRMRDITISEAEHGPAGARRYDVRAHVHPARPHAPAPRVRAGQLAVSPLSTV